MRIFDIKSSSNAPENETRFLGAYLPHDLDEYIRLRTFSMGISRSNLVKELLLEWQKNQPKKRLVLDAIAEKAFEFWKEHQAKNSQISKDVVRAFVSEMKKELAKCKITDKDIESIVDLFLHKIK